VNLAERARQLVTLAARSPRESEEARTAAVQACRIIDERQMVILEQEEHAKLVRRLQAAEAEAHLEAAQNRELRHKLAERASETRVRAPKKKRKGAATLTADPRQMDLPSVARRAARDVTSAAIGTVADGIMRDLFGGPRR
jgi:hypothetical protein